MVLVRGANDLGGEDRVAAAYRAHQFTASATELPTVDVDVLILTATTPTTAVPVAMGGRDARTGLDSHSD